MNERSEQGAAIVVAGVLLMLLLLISAGGTLTYVVHARRTAAAMAEARIAQQAATAANMQLQKAQAARQVAEEPAVDPEKTIKPPQLETAVQPNQGPIAQAIESMLHAQASAWNEGDLDQFMDHYWKSEDLTFSSGGKTTRGWSATLDRYHQRYPTREQMGQLQFDNLEITPLGNEAALVLGQWRVKRSPDALNGNFSLVVRKLNDQWKIVHDHTSRAE
jgi:ketosteroid isomerase-like protein